MNVFAKGIPDNLHTSYGQKHYRFVYKTKPCLANIASGGEKFWPTLWFNYVLQSLQQNQFQINLSTN